MPLKRVFLLALILLSFLCGCLYPSLPPDPSEAKPWYDSWHDFSQPNPACTSFKSDPTKIEEGYDCAISYAKHARDRYRDFLVDEAKLSEGFGYLLFAAGGAGLGVAAAGTSSDSALTTAELGIGGGTATGAVLWAQNKPKLNAYTEGYKAMQCVLNQAGQLRTGIINYPELNTQLNTIESPKCTNVVPCPTHLAILKTDLDTIHANLETAQQTLSGKQATFAKSPTPVNQQEVTDANQTVNDQQELYDRTTQTIADAEAQINTAKGVLSLDQNAGQTIIQQVQAVDTKVFAAAYKGEPDFATISGQKLPTMPFSGPSGNLSNATPSPGGHGALTESAPENWVTHMNDVINDTNVLKTLTTGVTTASPDFNQCITSLDQILTQSQNQQSPAQLQVFAPTDFHFDDAKHAIGQAIVSGGKPQYVPTVSDGSSNIQVTMGQQGNAFFVNVTITDAPNSHKLTVTDSSNPPQSTSITLTPPAPLKS